RVREQEQALAIAATWDARDQVRPLRAPCVELALDAVAGEVVAQQLGRLGLVARRVDGVQADQLLQELGDLVAERHASSLASSVNRLGACQSSGEQRCLIRPPSSSTGVPWVPTTWSPIARATTR